MFLTNIKTITSFLLGLHNNKSPQGRLYYLM